MTGHADQWTEQRMSRRQLLARAGTGAALLAPISWLAPTAVAGAAQRLARPIAATEYDAVVATEWFNLFPRLIQQTVGYSPPVAARAIGCAGVALYEAVVPGMPDHVSLTGIVNALPAMPADGRNAAYHWPTAANAALGAMARSLFPTAPASLRATIDDLEHRLAATGLGPGTRDRSIDRGHSVAAAVQSWAEADGGHEGYLRNFPSSYSPPVGDGLWEPTPPGLLPALQPYWGANRCMVLESAIACPGGSHPPFSVVRGSAFHSEAMEVYETVNALTPDQLEIARFWADDPGATATPPGHSLSILTQLVARQDRSLAFAAEAYLKLGVAVCDAFIACWRAKYDDNLLRPITYIRREIDPAWGDPLPLTTPPFPEYPSGHSVQSGAAATVLTAMFGAIPFVDHTHDVRGFEPRPFDSFEAFADEAAISRLYGGIHFRAAIEQGLSQGRCIGSRVAELPLRR